MKTSTIEIEYNEINEKNGWTEAFQSIKEKSEQEARERKFQLDESSKVNNRRLNRYRDVNPYDHSRIILHKGDTDYINANLVKMDRADRMYILTQGPLENTVGHFWLMVWEQNSMAILMLNKLIEKKQIKCYKYWPEHKGAEHKLQLPDVDLSIEYIKSEEYSNYTKRYFKLTHTELDKSRDVIQFHYNTWPDFGIPSSPNAFLQFLKQVRNSGALNPDVGPAIVHCSAGIGRSGTFCLVDTCLVLVDNEGENKISVQELLLELRRYRMGLIQTSDQLYFSYQAIIEGIKHFNQPESNDYDEVPFISYDEENDNNGSPPSPPPRGTSLNAPIVTSRASWISSSASAHEFRDPKVLNSGAEINCNVKNDDDNNGNDNEDDENSENGNRPNVGGVADGSGGMLNRPLPPLPIDDSLEEIEESSNDEDDDDDEDKIDENDSGDDLENIDHGHAVDVNNSNAAINVSKESSLVNADKVMANGVVAGSLLNHESERSDTTELRRRKRIEKHVAMEEKIKEIKRKQKAAEEEKAQAPKKRRSLMIKIAAGVGVVIGIFCVYAYAKLI